MTDLRKLARGQECLVRIPNICNWDPETTVLAHIRRGGESNPGMGARVADVCATWACSSCHDVIDRRNAMGSYSLAEIDSWLLDAQNRYLVKLVEMGVLKW